MVESLSEREQNVLELSLGLLTRLREEEDLDERCLDEASIDSQFLFRFEPTWCEWVSRIRKMMWAMMEQMDDRPFSVEDGVCWHMHLESCARHFDDPAFYPYFCFDIEMDKALGNPGVRGAEREKLRERRQLEVIQTAKIITELKRLALRYGFLPPEHEQDRYAPIEIKQQFQSVVGWVIWGHVPPCLLDERTRLIENQVQAESRCSIRPWKWGNEEPFSMNRMPLRTRIRTWAIYFLSERGGGDLQENPAVDLWNSEFPNQAVTVEGFQDNRTRLFDFGSGKALFPSWSESFDSIRSRWAVLVGINEYDDPGYGQLQVCVKDVEAVRDALVSGGFCGDRVYLLTDSSSDGRLPTRAHILASIRRVAEATEPDDLLLFYFSGHGGVGDDGEACLVSRDAERIVLSDTAVPISRLTQIVKEAPACKKVIVLDACHSGAEIDAKAARSMSEAFIRRVFEESEGIVVLASCKQGELSHVWEEHGRSVFTHYLLEALEGCADSEGKGFVTVQDVNRHVVDGVKLWAVRNKRSQNPTFQASIVGDIPLVRYQ